MKIKILGSAAYERVPAMFCNCPACRTAKISGGKNIRTQTQTLIDDRLLIDFGSDNYQHFLRSGADFSAIRTLLITHSHSDHFNKADFLMRENPYAHDLAYTPLSVFGNAFCGSVITVNKETCGIEYTILQPYTETENDGYRFTALPAVHSTESPFVYIISDGAATVFYSLDTGLPPQELYNYIAAQRLRFDAVICDCTYGLLPQRNCGGHMSLLDNLTHRNKLADTGAVTGNTKWIATHFSHNALIRNGCGVTHEDLAAECGKYGMVAAYDGYEFTV